MRVNVQIPSLCVGGAEAMCVELVNGLAERGCHVRVLAAHGAPSGDLGGSLASGVIRSAIGSAPYSPITALRAARSHRAEHCDVVIYHLTPSLLTLAAQRIEGSRVPAVYVEHGPRLDRRSAFRDLPTSVLYGAASAIVCVTDPVRDQYIARIAPRVLGRTFVIPNGVHVERIAAAVRSIDRTAARMALGLPTAGLIAGIVGRLVPVKGHREFLTAWSGLRKESTGGDWPHLAIVGDGPLRATLRAEVERAGLGDVVHLVGAVLPVTPALAAIDLVALPSLSEGQPMVLLEAMAAGLPIAATDVGGVAALLGDVGALVREGGHHALAAEALRILRLSSNERALLGARAHARVRAQFDVSQMVDGYLRLCRALHAAGS